MVPAGMHDSRARPAQRSSCSAGASLVADAVVSAELAGRVDLVGGERPTADYSDDWGWAKASAAAAVSAERGIQLDRLVG